MAQLTTKIFLRLHNNSSAYFHRVVGAHETSAMHQYITTIRHNFLSTKRINSLTGLCEGAAVSRTRLKSGWPPNGGLVRDGGHQRPIGRLRYHSAAAATESVMRRSLYIHQILFVYDLRDETAPKVRDVSRRVLLFRHRFIVKCRISTPIYDKSYANRRYPGDSMLN